MRKIVCPELEPQSGRDEVKVETGVAKMLQALAEFLKGTRAPSEGHGDFDALAEIESLEGRLSRKLRLGCAKILNHAAKIAAQRRNRHVIPDVQRRELLGEVVPIRVREHPLGEVVRKTLRQEVVGAQGLKGVVENRSIAAMFKPSQ
jgi:hypothetical protein